MMVRKVVPFPHQAFTAEGIERRERAVRAAASPPRLRGVWFMLAVVAGSFAVGYLMAVLLVVALAVAAR